MNQIPRSLQRPLPNALEAIEHPLQTASALSQTKIKDIFEAISYDNFHSIMLMLEKSGLDMTIVDEATKDTILHRAISIGNTGLINELIEHISRYTPYLLGIKNHLQCTPLMQATLQEDVRTMQLLIKVQAPTGVRMRFTDIKQEVGRGFITQTLLLIEAKGCINKAFLLAVELRQKYSAIFYCCAGADISPILHANTESIEWLLRNQITPVLRITQEIIKAKKIGDTTFFSQLTMPRIVLSALDGLSDATKDKVVEVINLFIEAGADIQELSSEITFRLLQGFNLGLSHAEWLTLDIKRGVNDIYALEHLIALGADTITMLVNIAQWPPSHTSKNNKNKIFKEIVFYKNELIKKVFTMGGDVVGAMKKSTHDAYNLATAALAATLENNDLSLIEKKEKITLLMNAGGVQSAQHLAQVLLEGKPSIEQVSLLISAGLPPNAIILNDLSEYACYENFYSSASHNIKKYLIKTVESPALNVLRDLLINHRNGFFESLQTLALKNKKINDDETLKWRKYKKINRGTSTPQEIVLYKIIFRDLLISNTMGNPQKIESLKSWMCNDSAREAGASLLIDAVTADKPATAKLLVMAGCSGTDTFINLSYSINGLYQHGDFYIHYLLDLDCDPYPAMSYFLKEINLYLKNGNIEEAHHAQNALNEIALRVAQYEAFI